MGRYSRPHHALNCACLLLLALQVSYLRGIFPEDHYKTVDMRNLDSERRRQRAGVPSLVPATLRTAVELRTTMFSDWPT